MTSVQTEQGLHQRRGRGAPELHPCLSKPISIYQVHLSSWMRVPEQHNRPLTYAEIAPKLADYVQRLNFTHVEFLPTWAGFGPDQEFLGLAESLHQRQIGVILGGEMSAAVAKAGPMDGLRVGPDIAISGCPLRWDADWARETLDYFSLEPGLRIIHFHHLAARNPDRLSESRVLPLSHEFMSRGQGALLAKMSGDEWQKFANLRLLFAWMIAHPGKKLLFMGAEFGQWSEWNDQTSLDWHLLREGTLHVKLQRWVEELNGFYGSAPALHQSEANAVSLASTIQSDPEQSALGWLRYGNSMGNVVLCVFNFTPTPRFNYRIGVPFGGFWKERLNSDAQEYGGSGQGNLGGIEAAPFGWHDQPQSLTMTLPPLAAVFFERGADAA
jgi:1,4-alpha-glucan branching enzyme